MMTEEVLNAIRECNKNIPHVNEVNLLKYVDTLKAELERVTKERDHANRCCENEVSEYSFLEIKFNETEAKLERLGARFTKAALEAGESAIKLKQESDRLRTENACLRDGLKEIGKHQHDGRRDCCCSILSRMNEALTKADRLREGKDE